MTKKTLPYNLEERIVKINEVYRGWVNNRSGGRYRLASIYTKLKSLDEWLRNRPRGVTQCIWHDWKKPERKRKNLIRLGVKQGQAYAWTGPPGGRTNMGGWAGAQSPILGTTITVARLRKRGYEQMASYYQKLCPEIQ